MTMSFGSKLQLQPGSWLELLYDVIIGIVTGAYHSLYLSSRTAYFAAVEPVLRRLLRILGRVEGEGSCSSDSQEGKKDKGELKVVAVGYGRTGTVSSTSTETDHSFSASQPAQHDAMVEKEGGGLLLPVHYCCLIFSSCLRGAPAAP